jgi:hypothetical protein
MLKIIWEVRNVVRKSDKARSSGPTCKRMDCGASDFGDMVKGLLGPMMKEVIGSDTAK